jgi:hypothetical protein
MDAGIKEFQIMVFTMDMIAEQAATTDEAAELIMLAASYGPPKSETD